MKTKLFVLAALFVFCGSCCAQNARKNQKAEQSPEALVNRLLKQQDADKDGKISRAESKGLLNTNFKRIDEDGNGFVTRAELDQLAKRLAAGRTQTRRGRGGMSDEQVRKQAPDGVKLELNIPYREGNEAWKLDLAMPKAASEKPRPAIVIVHGGGWKSGDKRTANFMGLTLRFAERGYVCVTINYRLGQSILPCVEDAKCAVRWLRANAKKYNIDPNRIGAYGNSAGAHLVVMLGISESEPKLEGDGPWKEFSSTVQAVVASATPTKLGFRGPASDQVKLVAPMSYVHADAPPLLLFQEVSDKVVNVSNSDDFVKALKEAGAKDITYKRYKDGSGHGVFTKNLKATEAEMARFFARTLKGTRQ